MTKITLESLMRTKYPDIYKDLVCELYELQRLKKNERDRKFRDRQKKKTQVDKVKSINITLVD